MKALFVQKNYGDLAYCVYAPEIPTGKKRPLVLFMHGAGERGEDNQSQLKHAITKVVKRGSRSPFMDAVVLAPQCPKNVYWTNVDHKNGVYRVALTEETKLLRQVAALVREYVSREEIDEKRVYVIGMSMGGYATWELIARYPELFAAAVPICGGGPIDRASQLKDFPLYVFHGKRDPIVQYRGSEEMVQALLATGSTSVLFKTYGLGGHNIWNKAITFKGNERIPALAEWLFSQSK